MFRVWVQHAMAKAHPLPAIQGLISAFVECGKLQRCALDPELAEASFMEMLMKVVEE